MIKSPFQLTVGRGCGLPKILRDVKDMAVFSCIWKQCLIYLSQYIPQKTERKTITMEEKKFDLSQLYIVDFVKNLGHRKNIFAVLYLVLNVLFIAFWIQMFVPNIWTSLLYSVLIYGITATVALSPAGEWLFRLLNGCKKINDPKIQSRLEPLFQEVKERARTKHSDCIINDNISLYIRDDDDPNAFAMGRRTVCVTRGLLALPDEQIKAVLGHEFGHLATHDTDLTLLITVGNLIVTVVVSIVRVVMAIYNAICSIVVGCIGESRAIAAVANAIASVVTTLFINGLMWVWTRLGILMVMKSSRDAEYEADAFSCDLGYSEGLVSFFRFLQGLERSLKKSERSNIFAALASSHPDTAKRIERIENRAMIRVDA